MSLAFALMAAINGSTGSSATLSHGLFRTSHTGVSPTETRFSLFMGDGASRPGRCRAKVDVRRV
jgi:hypothetical protein